MGKRVQKFRLKDILWGIGMLLFLLFMADWYCRMVYGGNVFYVVSGRNEITDEEREFLRDQGTLIYGETLDSFPVSLYDASLEGQNGFATDLMDQLSLESGAQMVFQPVEWPEIFQKLENGEVDLIQVTYTEERADRYYLTVPVYRNRGVVFLENQGEEVRTLAELGDRTLAGIREDHALSVLKERDPRLSVTECSSIEECAKLLRDHQVDGIVADEQNLMYYIQGEKLFQDYYMVEEQVYEADVVFALRTSDAELGRILDKAIYQLRNKNILEKIQKKWFLTSILQDALPVRRLYLWGAVLGAGIAGICLMMFRYLHIRLKRLVELRTRELAGERERVQTILESIPQDVLEVNEQGEILMSNRAGGADPPAEALLFDWEGRKLKDPGLQKILQEIQREGHAQREIEAKERWYHITGNSMQGKQMDGHMILVAEDITLSRMQEQKSMQNEKMIAIGQLASGVSHELKNPLEIICNYCYAVKNGILMC